MTDIHYDALVRLARKLYKPSSESTLLDLLGCGRASDIGYHDHCFILDKENSKLMEMATKLVPSCR
jgi:hypothetical protein